jgi:hypothetical protein
MIRRSRTGHHEVDRGADLFRDALRGPWRGGGCGLVERSKRAFGRHLGRDVFHVRYRRRLVVVRNAPQRDVSQRAISRVWEGRRCARDSRAVTAWSIGASAGLASAAWRWAIGRAALDEGFLSLCEPALADFRLLKSFPAASRVCQNSRRSGADNQEFSGFLHSCTIRWGGSASCTSETRKATRRPLRGLRLDHGIRFLSCTRFRRHQVRCFMEQEVRHGEKAVYAGVQA